MSLLDRVDPEVFSVHEVAKAAGVAADDVRRLLAESDLTSAGDRYVPLDTAVELVRLLRTPGGRRLAHRRLFSTASFGAPKPAVPLAASGVLHAGIVLTVLWLTSLGLRSAPREPPPPEPARLVFLALPGPGGGGGGGGLRQPSPPPQARLKGKSPVASPVVVSKREARIERERQIEPPPAPAVIEEPPAAPPPAPDPAPAPPVAAPVASAPADADDRAGVLEEAAPSRVNGPGQGGGAGTGQGTGMGEGSGTGIGDGSFAGTGGGPYRPGSGVTPPVLEREVKPLYTDEGRRRGVEGDVVMEVVVRADGTVGSVRVVQGLGSGLDARAADAVRQWRFAPARRHGRAVDVLVEVAVEFRLR